MSLFSKVLWIALAGALGALSRWGLGSAVQHISSTDFPWGTMAVNVLGSLLFGLVWTLGEGRVVSQEVRMIVLTGFMGSFTTFSTFMFESGQLFRARQMWAVAGNLIGAVVLGLIGLYFGLKLGRQF